MTAPEIHDSLVAARLADVRTRVTAACERSARAPSAVTIVAVTKFFPADFIRKAYALGLAHIGENRVQELIDKFEDGSIMRDCCSLQVHLVGHLQSNKVRRAVQLTASIDTVDSVELARLVSRETHRIGKTIRMLVEVNTSGEAQKYGISPDETLELVERMLPLEGLNIAGLMTVGPNVSDEEAIRHSFEMLRVAFDKVKQKLNPPNWSVLSMGMSGDYEIAIEEGATEIRLGTALFGPRRNS
jgi:pyridoxal phosphate enzyme (YggS family)